MRIGCFRLDRLIQSISFLSVVFFCDGQLSSLIMANYLLDGVGFACPVDLHISGSLAPSANCSVQKFAFSSLFQKESTFQTTFETIFFTRVENR